MFGQKGMIVEEGSLWAVNPTSFKCGYICLRNAAKKVLGERLLSIHSERCPILTQLHDMGCKWQEQWAVNLKCLYGADAGVEVVYKPTTVAAFKRSRH